MGQDVNITPTITIGDHSLEVVDKFTYLGSTISSNLSLGAELNARIDKAATAMAHLAKRVWDLSDTQQDENVPGRAEHPSLR